MLFNNWEAGADPFGHAPRKTLDIRETRLDQLAADCARVLTYFTNQDHWPILIRTQLIPAGCVTGVRQTDGARNVTYRELVLIPKINDHRIIFIYQAHEGLSGDRLAPFFTFCNNERNHQGEKQPHEHRMLTNKFNDLLQNNRAPFF